MPNHLDRVRRPRRDGPGRAAVHPEPPAPHQAQGRRGTAGERRTPAWEKNRAVRERHGNTNSLEGFMEIWSPVMPEAIREAFVEACSMCPRVCSCQFTVASLQTRNQLGFCD